MEVSQNCLRAGGGSQHCLVFKSKFPPMPRPKTPNLWWRDHLHGMASRVTQCTAEPAPLGSDMGLWVKKIPMDALPSVLEDTF